MDPLRPLAGLVAGTLLALTPAVLGAQSEGPLDNDSYLPVDEAAEAELARGDQAFALAMAPETGPVHEAARAEAWTPTCEAWRNALARSRAGTSARPRPVAKPGDPSPWPAPEGDVDRFTEGIEEAVFRRLAALPKAGQLAWRERFSPLAERELERAAGLSSALARIERELPATPGAARSAVLLSEIAFERGDPAASRRWLARARRHVSALGLEEAAILQGIARREALLLDAPQPPEASWSNATALEFVAGRDLEITRGAPQRARPLGAGPQAGLAFLDGDRVLLQTPSALWLISGADARLSGPFENQAWLRAAALEVDATVAPGDGPGWRLDPAASASSAVLVAGRSFGGSPNVLACVDMDRAGSGPTLRWALAAAATEPAGGERDSGEEYEFQPGPLWTEGLVIALVRRSSAASGEHELELRALEPSSGALRWRAYLGKGGERVRDTGRFVRRGVASMPAEPLVMTSSGIFASAQLGFAALLDPLDGRARYSIRNRRRPGAERGWTGWGSGLTGQGRVIAWAPADSDHLYVLDADGPAQRGTPLIATPEPLGEAEALVAADEREAVVLSRSGARRTLAHWDARSGSRRDALHLGPEEVFSGRPLASSKRVLAASDRALYLFDRSSDLSLLAAVTLGGPVPRGGNLWADASRVFVLSNRHVEVFRVR